MIDTAAKPGRPLELALARIALAALVGLVVLPSLFFTGVAQVPREPDSTTAAIWLSLAAIVTLWLFAEARVLAVALASHRTFQCAARPVGWLVTLVAVVVAQIVLRRPFVTVVGGWASASGADIAFAVTTLLLVVITLALLYFSAVPLVTIAARGALDALVPTVEDEEAGQPLPTATGPTSANMQPEPVTVAIDEATATVAAAPVVGFVPVDVSRPAAIPDADETEVGSRSVERIAAATNGPGNPDGQDLGQVRLPKSAEPDAGVTIVPWPPAAESGAAATVQAPKQATESDASATVVEWPPAVEPARGQRAPAEQGGQLGGSRDV